jgi:hypothetical protein
MFDVRRWEVDLFNTPTALKEICVAASQTLEDWKAPSRITTSTTTRRICPSGSTTNFAFFGDAGGARSSASGVAGVDLVNAG